jgi:tetratricopeptide (TPR) repeat protein
MATVPDALAIAIQHHQSGRLQAAEQIYRQILAVAPEQPDALHLLGVIAHQAGSHELAVEHIERAIRWDGTKVAFHNNLGAAYRALGKAAEAIACYRRALELNPKLAETYNNLGNALKNQGNSHEAVACWRRAVELKPDYAEPHSNLGNALMDQGSTHEAVACYRRALELKPNLAETYSNLGNALKNLGNSHEAVACYRRALELKPDMAEMHNNLGDALKDQGGLHEAVACYCQALKLKPDDAEAHTSLGSALEELGDLHGAKSCFQTALRHDARCAFAYHRLAGILAGNLPEEDLAAQRRLLEDVELTDTQRLLLHFGLAQVLDARGEYAEAAAHLERANALRLSELCKRGPVYDPKEFGLYVTQTIKVFAMDYFERVRGFGLASEVPVFVVGLPRSGTTLVEQILASHSNVFGAGEIKLTHDILVAIGAQSADSLEVLRQLDSHTAGRLASQYLEKLRALCPAALRIVDKLPDNYLCLGLLASLFPRAKLIHCRRDLRDVAVSCWMTHFHDVRWANNQQHIASRFHEYQRMMGHWRKVLPVPMLEVDYEEMVADLEGMARRLVSWCGLEWEPSCLEFHRATRPVRTASVVQVRQPVFNTSVGRWKHYEQALASMFAAIPGGR